MRTRSWCWTKAAWSSAVGTATCWPKAGSMHRCGGASRKRRAKASAELSGRLKQGREDLGLGRSALAGDVLGQDDVERVDVQHDDIEMDLGDVLEAANVVVQRLRHLGQQ